MTSKMKLVRVADGVEIKPGDTVTTFRGDRAVLEGANRYYVYLRLAGETRLRECYPGVIDAQWVAAD